MMLLTSPNSVHQQPQAPFQYQHSRYPRTLDFDSTADPFAVVDQSFGNLSSTAALADSARSFYTFAHQQQQQQQQQPASDETSSSAAISSVGDDLSQLPDLMPSEPWALASQYTPKTFGRMSHHRESSLSSLGSAGPASPFNHSTSNPQIAVSDPSSDGFAEMQAQDGTNSYYQLAKAMAGQGAMYSGYHNMSSIEHPDMSYPATIPLQQQRPRTDKAGLLPAPEFGNGNNNHNRSHPASVASSTVGGDSPATPSLGEPEDDKRRSTKPLFNEPPKLDRTMTDIYSDELYNPSFTITTAPQSTQQLHALSPSNELFAQRLSAANTQHLSATQSPSSNGSRDRSPFRHGSPHAPMSHDFGGNFGGPSLRFNSAHQMRENEKAEQDAQMIRQQMSTKTETDTPKTISPKDAMLEFPGVDADTPFPSLFPSQESNSDYGAGQMSKMPTPHDQSGLFQRPQSQSTQQQQSTGGFSYMATPQHMSAAMHVPQQYPFIAHPRQQHQQSSPPQLNSAESSSSSTSTPARLTKPSGASADSGTYTCTYHGCTLRFETPALLQKHKREGHRQPQGLGVSAPTRVPDPTSPMSGSILNSQAGPHRCDRINPSTGKPCSTIFSRPYDLTRHEDTIHNARKQKVRCNLCTEEKSFSRADALTRHYRVCHPDVEFPGKYRRRGGN